MKKLQFDLSTIYNSDNHELSEDSDDDSDNYVNPTTSNMASTPNEAGEASNNNPAASNMLIGAEDLSALLARHTLNDYARVQGLKYFCGGEERHPQHPNLVCHTDPRDFFKDIEMRTTLHFDDKGRLELCRQYSLGAARLAIEESIKNNNNNYEAVKADILAIYPDGRRADLWHETLTKAQRKQGETLREFYTRLQLAYGGLTREQPTYRPLLRKYFADRLMECFPLPFRGILTQDEKKDPLKILIKGYEWAKNHPAAKLTDEEIFRDRRNKAIISLVEKTDPSEFKRENVLAPTRSLAAGRGGARFPSPSARAFSPHPRSFGPRIPFTRDFNPLARVPLPRGNTFQAARVPQNSARTILCFNCNKPGHYARDCRLNNVFAPRHFSQYWGYNQMAPRFNQYSNRFPSVSNYAAMQPFYTSHMEYGVYGGRPWNKKKTPMSYRV